MQISYASQGLTAKSKDQVIQLGSTVTVNGYAIEGAGEYDVAGVQLEVANLERALAFFIRVEDLTLTYLSGADPKVVDLDQASSTDILLIEVASDQGIDQLKPILKALEPGYLFLIGPGATPELRTQLNLPVEPSSTLKVSRLSLPQEGTFLVNPT